MKYREVVYIQEKQSTRNADGQWSESWVNLKKKFVHKRSLKADEYFEAKSVNAVHAVTFRTRFDPSINEEMRIMDNGQPYEIRGVLHGTGINRETEIITEAVVSSGD